MPCSLSWPSWVPLVSRSDCISSLYLPGSVGVIVAYMPSTPVHFPAQLAKRCGAVAGSVASAPSTGTVSTGTSVVVVSVGAGAGASAFSQPASNTSAAALAMITLFCIMRLLPIPNASASISFLLGDDLREQIGRAHV